MTTLSQCQGVSTYLAFPKLEAIGVEKEFGLVEEFRGELLHIGAVLQTVLPGFGDGMEQPVSMVKPIPLQKIPNHFIYVYSKAERNRLCLFKNTLPSLRVYIVCMCFHRVACGPLLRLDDMTQSCEQKKQV